MASTKTGDYILNLCTTKRTILFQYQNYQHQNQNNANRQNVYQSDRLMHETLRRLKDGKS